MKLRWFFSMLLVVFISVSCQQEEQREPIKYAFLFIGDGMGLAQVNLTEAYLAAVDGEKGFQNLSFSNFPHTGQVSTFADNRFITCSAAAGTAFATGNKTNINRIAMDTSATVPLKSIATICKEQGMKVGILSSVSLDHATPAVFYAHQPHRGDYFEIGLQLAASDFDYFAGGGFREPLDTLDGVLVNAVDRARENGFTYIDDEETFRTFSTKNAKVITVHPGLLGSGAMPYAIDNPVGPTLADFTAKGIELLDNEKGFFMMIEGGKIDWACHSKDAASAVQEAIAFDEAVQVAIDFYKLHPDETLILVTADHETGGLALGNQFIEYESHYDLLQYQQVSVDRFNEQVETLVKKLSGNFDRDHKTLLKLVDESFGLGSSIPLTEKEKSNLWFAFEKTVKSTKTKTATYSSYPPITEAVIGLMSDKAGVGWTGFSHTGINVPIYALGPGGENFDGLIDNTDIPELMLEAMAIPQGEENNP